MRKINYRQQKKTREEARKVRKTEKLEKRQTSVPTSTEGGDSQNQLGKPPEAT